MTVHTSKPPQPSIPSLEEMRARTLPPAGYEDCIVAARGKLLYWGRRGKLQAGDQVVFFDGDCRDVLLPDDPRLQK